MKKLNEDYTAAALAGVPMFCVNRFYNTGTSDTVAKHRYRFYFDNGYGASIVEFHNRMFSGGCQYELALIGPNDILTDKIMRGDDKYMMKLLNNIERVSNVLQEPGQLTTKITELEFCASARPC